MFSIDTVRFQGDVSENYWRTEIAETRNNNGTEYTRAEYCSRF